MPHLDSNAAPPKLCGDRKPCPTPYYECAIINASLVLLEHVAINFWGKHLLGMLWGILVDTPERSLLSLMNTDNFGLTFCQSVPAIPVIPSTQMHTQSFRPASVVRYCS